MARCKGMYSSNITPNEIPAHTIPLRDWGLSSQQASSHARAKKTVSERR
jgi:hypothetical protein